MWQKNYVQPASLIEDYAFGAGSIRVLGF